MSEIPDISHAVGRIREARAGTAPERSLLVAISGIDGCGKGYVTARMVDALKALGFRTVGINIDGWLNLPPVRFSGSDPAGSFYSNAIRFDEMFSTLVLPLRDTRSVRVEANHAEETTEFERKLHEFYDVDIVVLEGIYLLKREFLKYYDLSFWVECSFETALRRAVARAQEGLEPGETIRAYEAIYFPAQKIHFQRDNPQAAATAIIHNEA